MHKFEDAMSAVIALVIYMPMLMGTGGNSGSQSSTLIIRGMATGDIELRDFVKVMWKEIRVGVIVGLCLSALNYARIVYLDHNPPMVAVTVCCLNDTHRDHSQTDRIHAAYGREAYRHRPGPDGRTDDGLHHRHDIAVHILPHGGLLPAHLTRWFDQWPGTFQ